MNKKRKRSKQKTEQTFWHNCTSSQVLTELIRGHTNKREITAGMFLGRNRKKWTIKLYL